MEVQKATYSNCTQTGDFRYASEASDLGFPVGKIPRYLDTDMGNKLSFELTEVQEDGSAIYKQVAGCLTLRVFND